MTLNRAKETVSALSVRPTIPDVVSKTPSGGGDMEVHKAMLIYYVVTSNVCLRHSLLSLFIVVWQRYMARKHTNEHRVIYDYGFYAMVKTTQAGVLKVSANLYLNWLHVINKRGNLYSVTKSAFLT